jgi:hypothetical protein
MVHFYNPNYEAKVEGPQSKAGLSKKQETLFWKITKAKRAGKVAQVIEHSRPWIQTPSSIATFQKNLRKRIDLSA